MSNTSARAPCCPPPCAVAHVPCRPLPTRLVCELTLTLTLLRVVCLLALQCLPARPPPARSSRPRPPSCLPACPRARPPVRSPAHPSARLARPPARSLARSAGRPAARPTDRPPPARRRPPGRPPPPVAFLPSARLSVHSPAARPAARPRALPPRTAAPRHRRTAVRRVRRGARWCCDHNNTSTMEFQRAPPPLRMRGCACCCCGVTRDPNKGPQSPPPARWITPGRHPLPPHPTHPSHSHTATKNRFLLVTPIF
jgi:hypothetical protein